MEQGNGWTSDIGFGKFEKSFEKAFKKVIDSLMNTKGVKPK